MDLDIDLSRLAAALGIGLLVGLERGWRSRDEEDTQRAAGLRTFALTGLLGGVTGNLSAIAGGAVIGFVFLAFSAAFGAFHWLEARQENNLSVTSVIAGMLTFMLGTMAVIGDMKLAIAAAVAMTLLLALKDQLHAWVAALSWSEIRAVLTLLAMTFLLLPVLPNHPVDPWNIINPASIWLIAITIGALSFCGYIAVRTFGDQIGLMMAAVAGGLASSTATTLTLARIAREHPASAPLVSAGILTAGLIMLARVSVIVMALNPAIFRLIALPMAAAAVVMLAAVGLLLFRNAEKERPKLSLSNPLELAMALKLAVLIAAIMLVTHFAQRYFGSAGVLVTAVLSGLADVDPIVISMVRLGGPPSSLAVASQAILIAVASNTAAKSALTLFTGGGRAGWRVIAVNSTALATAVLVYIWLEPGSISLQPQP